MRQLNGLNQNQNKLTRKTKNMNVGQTIRRLRKEKGIPQFPFGEQIGLSQASLSQIETGTTIPHKSTMLKICEALEVSEALLMFLSIEKSDIPERKRKMFELARPVMEEILKK